MLIYFIFLKYFSFSLYSYNQFFQNNYTNIAYLSTFYKRDKFEFSQRFVKRGNLYYLDNLNLTFPFKNKRISLFDFGFYPVLPFSNSFFARGIKIVDRRYKILLGRERNTGSFPLFKKNEFLSLFEGIFYNSFPFEWSGTFLIKRDFKKNPLFAISNNFKYQTDEINFEKRIGISLLNPFFGIADETRFSLVKEDRGFNLLFRGKTKNYSLYYYDLKNYYIGIGGTGFSKLSPYLHGTLQISYYKSSNFWAFLNDYRINIIYPPFPQIGLLGGFEGSKNFVFKRGIDLSYNKKFFFIRISHLKGIREINYINLEFRKYPIFLNFYSVLSKTKDFRFSFRISPKKFLSFEGYFGEDIERERRKFFGLRTGFSIYGMNFMISYYATEFNKKLHSSLSFSISGILKLGEMGLGRCYGFVFIDENGNFKYDSGEKLVEGIKVILDGKKEVFTDRRGRFSFLNLTPGKHKIEIKYGALPAYYGSGIGEKFEFDMGFLGVKNFEIPITPLGEIKGVVFIDKNGNGKKDKNEEGVKNAIVIINGNSTITDEEGVFYITALPPGTYEIKIARVPLREKIVIPEALSIFINPGEKIYNIELPIYPLKKKIIRYKRF